ncbi:thiamine biosynthesis lipoprotein [Sulfuritortus calidifontis]|uniref:FAD:protein FMN transferase n=1 Tax=Sulfuritortus calidifontis TaxID=1914471 RepID=A0A4R3JYD0_9PROT|nr:FAD:protein FMN transferase [Sulfuritortus calidifontis]TCS71901.1 thiamine biosynthesis lipoprotein [Sulfuritortus calidifontis]
MRLIRLLLSLWLLALLAACGEAPPYRQQAYVFGTLVEISIYGEDADKAQAVTAQVLRDFDRLHGMLHAWQPGALARVNELIAQGATDVSTSPGLIPILQDAARHAAQSDHLFNPAIGNLVRLWGFHADRFEGNRVPDPAQIERLVKAAPTMADLELAGYTVRSRNRAVRIDLGGYAKGYALDLAAAYLKSQGVRNALINIGGNVLALGRHGTRPWRVGIQHPRRSGAIALIDLNDGEAIGTSGDYQRYFEVGDKRYCHIIDPRTGWPVQGVQAVTVLARGPQAGVLSDVASKPLFVSGAAGWRQQAEKLGVREIMFIDGAGRISVTAALAPRLQWQAGAPAAPVVP